MESCGVTNGFVWLPQRLATAGCAFRAAALHKTWQGGSWGCDSLRRPGCAPAAAPCGELKAQIAKQPICQARTLEGKTGDPTGPRRAVERSIYRTLAPLAPGTHEPVSQEGGQPNVQSEACATRLSTVRVRGIVRLLHGTPSQHRLDLSHAIQHKRAAKPAPASGQQPQSQPSHETTAHETTAPQIPICRSSPT